MRKLTVYEHITLDGVIQAPGGPDEDTSGGFAHGGWIAPYSDTVLAEALRHEMNKPFDLLLGRKTFEIWAPYWPNHAEAWPEVMAATKYVASNNTKSSDWQPSVFLNENVADMITGIKQQPGPEIHVWGSGDLMQTLLKHNLVDAFWLMVYPLTLGVGKRLFADGTLPAAFKVTESRVTPKGVFIVRYERAGAVSSGDVREI